MIAIVMTLCLCDLSHFNFLSRFRLYYFMMDGRTIST